jgi:hypothetical protein
VGGWWPERRGADRKVAPVVSGEAVEGTSRARDGGGGVP